MAHNFIPGPGTPYAEVQPKKKKITRAVGWGMVVGAREEIGDQDTEVAQARGDGGLDEGVTGETEKEMKISL